MNSDERRERILADFARLIDGARDLNDDDYIDLMMRIIEACDRRATALSTPNELEDE